MLKNAEPSGLFLGAIWRGYNLEKGSGKSVTCSGIWNYIVMECFRVRGGFTTMFQWDKSKAKNINRIGTIAECIQGGYVPGLQLSEDERGREIVEEVKK